jgi:transcriptional regulator with PAS, ATPase and Fis domain
MFCKNDYIELNDVREALDNMPCGSDMENDSVELNGPLEEIEKNIIQKILKKNQMNQSKAAKKLGISRSTLWRKLQ